jgi:hypothetical protein
LNSEDDAETIIADYIDKAAHGNFTPLLGDQEEEWFAFCWYEMERDSEGALMEVRLDDMSLWLEWNFIKPNQISFECMYMPCDEVEDLHERPDEHITWPVFRVIK